MAQLCQVNLVLPMAVRGGEPDDRRRCVYTQIEGEREREIDIYIYIHTHIYIYMYVLYVYVYIHK